MTTTERSINVFVDGSGVFDAVVARSARAIVEKALADLEKRCGDRRPQVREVAAALGVHYRRAPRILAALGMRGRVRERATH
jgi:hypothetical protein